LRVPSPAVEVGVVEAPGRRRFAVAVFARTAAARVVDPAADAAIGIAARAAVDELLVRPVSSGPAAG
jgi:beta-lactamase class A